jgi:hypothetical protein
MPTDDTSPPYTDFDLMPIAGKWRHGSSTWTGARRNWSTG